MKKIRVKKAMLGADVGEHVLDFFNHKLKFSLGDLFYSEHEIRLLIDQGFIEYVEDRTLEERMEGVVEDLVDRAPDDPDNKILIDATAAEARAWAIECVEREWMSQSIAKCESSVDLKVKIITRLKEEQP